MTQPRRFLMLPTSLVREVMPSLKLGELKVLLVVADQTLGWIDPRTGRRKEADWLTHSQLKARTGCASEAVSGAIDALVRRGLIMVTSEAGEPLSTPQERRRHRGKLFYALSERLLAEVRPSLNVESPVDKSVDNCRGATDAGSETETTDSQFGGNARQSEYRQPKTTKSSSDRNITPNGGAPSMAPSPMSVGKVRQDRSPSSPANPDVRRFLGLYRALFRQRSQHDEPPPISWGKDGKLVKDLLSIYPYGRLADLLAGYFALDDPWVRKRGYSLGAFRAVLGQLLMDRPRLPAAPVAHQAETGQNGVWSKAGDIRPQASPRSGPTR